MQSLAFEELIELDIGEQISIVLPQGSNINSQSEFANKIKENKNFIVEKETDKFYIHAGTSSTRYSISKEEIESGAIAVFLEENYNKSSLSKNNDGKGVCQYCGSPTKEVDTGMFSTYRVCTNKNCKEWK